MRTCLYAFPLYNNTYSYAYMDIYFYKLEIGYSKFVNKFIRS